MSFWTTSEKSRPANLIDGFTLDGSVRVPAANRNTDANGNPLGVKGFSQTRALNNSEIKLLPNPFNAPELIKAKNWNNTTELGYADVLESNPLFVDFSKQDRKSKLVVYDEEKRDNELTIIGNYEKSLPTFYEPVLWLDASDQSTIQFSSGQNVERWIDKSGNNNDAIQDTLSKQPSKTSEGILFGPDLYLLTPQLQNGTGAREIIAVLKQKESIIQNPTYLNSFWFSLTNQNYSSTLGILWRPTNEIFNRLHGRADFNATFADEETAIVNQYHGSNADISEIKARKNGVQLINTPTATPVLIDTVEGPYTLIGNGDHDNFNFTANVYYDGTIQEILYFNKQLTEQERQLLTNYLNQKWNVY